MCIGDHALTGESQKDRWAFPRIFEGFELRYADRRVIASIECGECVRKRIFLTILSYTYLLYAYGDLAYE